MGKRSFQHGIQSRAYLLVAVVVAQVFILGGSTWRARALFPTLWWLYCAMSRRNLLFL